MKTVVVSEYGKCRVKDLDPSPVDLAVVESGELAKRIRLRWLRDGTLEIEAGSHVGVVNLDCVSVRVQPKLAGSELGVLEMLDYAAGLRSLRELPLLRRLGAGLSLRDLVCLLLTRECDRLLRHGLRRDYLRREEALPALRGRLLVERQVTRRFGMLDRLECRYDERSGDILDNRLCAAALHVAARTAQDADVRAAARRLAADFSGVCTAGGFDARSAVERLTYHRANEHYRNAHRWARMLLDGAAFTDRHTKSGRTTHAFMVDMNTLFEDFVTRLLRDAFSGTSVVVRAQETLPGAIRGESGHSYTEIRPDVQLVRGRRLCPVDAKYKLYADKQVSTSDLFQSFAYAQAGSSSGEPPHAFIVYASEGGMPPKTVGLHRADGTVAARVTYQAVDIPKVLREETAREAWFGEARRLMASE
ncbi:McrC family protein [Actinomadura luteofluorescens]|uniref:McrC family protein n=1 Tax=Actinomadura luteofluorescens TaxID=46163 RepID=UPI00346DD760